MAVRGIKAVWTNVGPDRSHGTRHALISLKSVVMRLV